MEQWKIAAIIVYSLAVCPFCIGLIWHKIGGGFVKSVPGVFVSGYITMFALFEVMAVPMIAAGAGTAEIGERWYSMAGILSIVGLIINIVSVWKMLYHFIKSIIVSEWYTKLLIAAGAGLIVFSIAFVRPSDEDATVEIMLTNEATGTFYEYNPYSGDPYGGISLDKADAPLEVFYTVLTDRTGIPAEKMIHMVLPAFLLSLFYAVYWLTGQKLCGNEERKTDIFMTGVMVLSSISVYMNRDGMVGVFQNIWMDKTMLYACAAPYMFYLGITFMDHVSEEKVSVRGIWKGAGLLAMMAVTALAAQLMFHYGFLWSMALLIAAVLTGVVRRCLNHAGSDTDL